MSYVDVESFKTWLGVQAQDDDAQYQVLLDTASDQIDAYCQRSFGISISATRKFHPITSTVVYIDDIDDYDPAVAVKTDDNDDGTAETTWTQTTDYVFEPEGSDPRYRIVAVGDKSFTLSRRATIHVTGLWGYTTVPPGVQTACNLLARDGKAAMETKYAFGMVDLGDVVRSTRDNPVVRALLDPYRRLRVVA